MAEMFQDIVAAADWWTVVASIIVGALGFVMKQYVVPLLKVERRRRYARYIAVIADDVTDDLRQRYPQSDWLKYLDEGVDTLIGICRVDKAVARRAIYAALERGRD